MDIGLEQSTTDVEAVAAVVGSPGDKDNDNGGGGGRNGNTSDSSSATGETPLERVGSSSLHFPEGGVEAWLPASPPRRAVSAASSSH